jgi:hypothetical protein
MRVQSISQPFGHVNDLPELSGVRKKRLTCENEPDVQKNQASKKKTDVQKKDCAVSERNIEFSNRNNCRAEILRLGIG